MKKANKTKNMDKVQPKESIMEGLLRSQDEKWQFCVKLMYMLRSKEISISDTNIDIYKRVLGSMALDTMQEYEKKADQYKEFKKLYCTIP